MISPMCRVRMFGPRPLLTEATALLHEMGVVHIDTPPPELCLGFRPVEEDDEGSRELVELETLLERLRKVLLLIPPRPEEGFPADRSLLDADVASPEFSEEISGLATGAEGLHLALKESREEKDLLEKYQKVIRSLAPLLEGVATSPHLEMVGITIDRGAIDLIPLLRQALDELTGGDYQLFAADLDRETQAAVLVVGRSSSPRVRELLRERDLTEIRLPGRMAELPLKEALQEIRRRLEALPARIEEGQRSLELFSLKWHDTLESARSRVADRIDQIVVARRFLCSRYTFQVAGWIPARDVPSLGERLHSAFGEKVALEIDEKVRDGDVPVQIRNPWPVRPFEVFTRLLPLPLYGTIDPTPYFAFFFPLFFGLILGDIGYGMVIMVIALLVRRKSREGTFWRSISSVFLICSVYAILFGVLFGEFFATLGEHFGLHPILYDRVEAMTDFLLLAVAIGSVHVFLGLLLGMFNALRTRHLEKLFLRAGMIAALSSALFLVSTLQWNAPVWALWCAASLLAFSLVGITLLEGFTAPIEMVSSLGNILSYARIMAIGLASVILGLVANRLGALSDSLVLGVFIAAFLHGVNIVLGIFSPTIHSMRLHFVEFFGKFYEPGGRPYQPFRKSGGA